MVIRQLTTILKNKGGRNNSGQITSQHRGGRHKRLYRLLTFNNKYQGVARVLRIEYDPNRTGRIALLWFPNGILCYLLCADKVCQGQKLLIGGHLNDRRIRYLRNPTESLRLYHHLDLQEGNVMPLRYVPLGRWVFNVGVTKNQRTIYGKSAGVYMKLISKKYAENRNFGYAGLSLPSGQLIYVDLDVKVTLGRVSNVEHKLKKFYKAGQNRWRGWRPSVRGVAMNPVDHPHGGGEGKTSGGRPSVSAWGRLTKGVKTKKKTKILKYKLLTRRRNKLENYKFPYYINYYYHKLKYFGRKNTNYFGNLFKNGKVILQTRLH